MLHIFSNFFRAKNVYNIHIVLSTFPTDDYEYLMIYSYGISSGKYFFVYRRKVNINRKRLPFYIFERNTTVCM